MKSDSKNEGYSRASHTLNSREQKFIEELIKGCSIAEACRRAGYSRATCRSHIYRKFNNLNVRERLLLQYYPENYCIAKAGRKAGYSENTCRSYIYRKWKKLKNEIAKGSKTC